MKRVIVALISISALASHAEILATRDNVEVDGKDAVIYITDEPDAYCSARGGKRAFTRQTNGAASFHCWKFYNGMVQTFAPGWSTLFDYTSFALAGTRFAPPKGSSGWGKDRLADPKEEAARQSMLRLCAIKRQRTAACDEVR